MLASRAPVSLHHRIVAGGQRRRCVIEGKRGRARPRHFTQALESLRRQSPQPPPSPAAAAAAQAEAKPRQPPPLENAAFEEYYKMQEIVREEEWDVFMDVLRTPLPATFRINACRHFFKDIRSKFESAFRRYLESEVSNEYKEDAIRPLLWYPDNLAWHLNFSRKDLRKNQSLERYNCVFEGPDVWQVIRNVKEEAELWCAAGVRGLVAAGLAWLGFWEFHLATTRSL